MRYHLCEPSATTSKPSFVLISETVLVYVSEGDIRVRLKCYQKSSSD